ncbi:hypothetical protein WJX79_003715 [Trebouxia sp. C0005]
MAVADDKDIEEGSLLGNEAKPAAAADSRRVLGLPVHLVSGAAYCVASASMCLVCVILVKLADLLGLVTLEPWNMKIIQAWFPVNLIFVGMIWTSFFALKNLGVPMSTVLKNLTNLFVIGGDYFFYGKSYGSAVWLTLALMMTSAVCGAATDLAFNLTGYLWQLVNCFFTAAYSLYLRGVMDRLVSMTVNKTRLDEFSMVFYNNLLSLPLLLVLIWQAGIAMRLLTTDSIV